MVFYRHCYWEKLGISFCHFLFLSIMCLCSSASSTKKKTNSQLCHSQENRPHISLVLEIFSAVGSRLLFLSHNMSMTVNGVWHSPNLQRSVHFSSVSVENNRTQSRETGRTLSIMHDWAMSLSMFNCAALLFEWITNHTAVPVWFCQRVSVYPSFPHEVGRNKLSSVFPWWLMSATADQHSAATLTVLWEIYHDFILVCLLQLLCFPVSSCFIWATVIIVFNILNWPFARIISAWKLGGRGSKCQTSVL